MRVNLGATVTFRSRPNPTVNRTSRRRGWAAQNFTISVVSFTVGEMADSIPPISHASATSFTSISRGVDQHASDPIPHIGCAVQLIERADFRRFLYEDQPPP